MKITNITTGIVKGCEPLVGMASIEIDNILIINSLRIVDGANGLFISMPSQKTKDGYKDVTYFKSKESQEHVKAKVLEAFTNKLERDTKDNDLTPVDDGDMPF